MGRQVFTLASSGSTYIITFIRLRYLESVLNGVYTLKKMQGKPDTGRKDLENKYLVIDLNPEHMENS